MRFTMGYNAASQPGRSVESVAVPTFWDGVAQAFDITGRHPPYNTLDDKAANLYAGVLRNWLCYSTQAKSVAAQHLQVIGE